MLVEGQNVAGRYHLVALLGEGGMGAVWLARDDDAGEQVAIKFVRPELATERSLARFQREARLAAQVRHPNVVCVLDSGVADGLPFLVMELLEGQGLDERLEELPPPSVAEVGRWLAEALDGLEAVHAAGIVHRDLKPGNLFLVRGAAGACVKVLDFGLSRSLVATADGQPVPSLTQTHQFLGTPYYASPEQVRSAKRIDARSDLFSMGVILFEALAGRRPFDGPNAAAVIAAVVADDPPELSAVRPDLPSGLSTVVARALSRTPDDRYGSAREMAEALRVVTQSVRDLRATPRSMDKPLVDADTTPAQDAPLSNTRPTERVPPAPPRSRVGPLLVGVGLVAVLTAVGFGVLGEDEAVPLPREVPLVQRGATDPDNLVAGARFVGPPMPRLALLSSLYGVPSPTLARLRVVAGIDGYRLSTRPEASADEVAQMAGALQTEPGEPVDQEVVLVPQRLRTSASLNLRDAPARDAGLVRTLPAGALVMAMHGSVDGHASSLGGRGTWSWIAASGSHGGWSASYFLEAHHGCVPELEALLDHVPDGRGRAIADDAVVTRTRLRTRDGVVDAIMMVARDPERGRSHLLFFDTAADCGATLRLERYVPGHVEDVLLPGTEAAGGETLIVTAWHPGGEGPAREGLETWTVWTLGRAVSVWEARLPTSLHLPGRRASVRTNIERSSARAGYWPLRVRHQDGRQEFFRWTGRSLVADPSALVSEDPPEAD